MSELRIKGIVQAKLDVQTGISQSTGKEWQKQDLILKQLGEYGREVVITFFGDRMKSLDYCDVGDLVEVDINISSREYNGRYFTQCDGWRIDKLDSDNTQPSNLDAEYAAAKGSERPSASKVEETEDESDIPF